MADSEYKTEQYTDTCHAHGEFIGEQVYYPILKKPVRKGCPMCFEEARLKRLAEEAAEAQKKREAAERADQHRKRLSGVPLRFDGKTLDNFRVESDKHELALAAARRLVFAIQDGKEAPNLIFLGKPGTGKSHLCCGIVSALYRTHTVRRIDLPDLIREIRSTWSRKSERTEDEVLDFYGAADLLIIEEVGTGAGTDDERARVFQVINRRYEAMLPTVVVSNLSFDELQHEMGERVIDRLREGDRALVSFDWKSARSAA